MILEGLQALNRMIDIPGRHTRNRVALYYLAKGYIVRYNTITKWTHIDGSNRVRRTPLDEKDFGARQSFYM